MGLSTEARNKALVLEAFDALFYVMIHGRFCGEHRPVNWIGVDILRIAAGVLAEHWDVLQDEATRAESKSGLPMFGDKFLA